MDEPKKCTHRALTFWSGGFYVACADGPWGNGCGQTWVAVRRAGQGDSDQALNPESGHVQGPGDVSVEPHLLERIALAAYDSKDPEDNPEKRMEGPEDHRPQRPSAE